MTSLVGFGLLVPVLLLGVLVLAVAAVAGGRNEDPDGERPYALYLAAVAFVTIFLALGAFGAIVGTAADAALSDDAAVGRTDTYTQRITIGSEDFNAPDPVLPSGLSDQRDNERIRTAVIAGMTLVAAGVLFVLHDRRLGRFREAEVGAGWRTAQTSGYLVCFLAVLAVLAAVITFSYAVFQMAAPGVAGVSERKDGVQPAIVSGLVAVAAAGIFALHWRRLIRPDAGSGGRLAEVVAPLPPPPPPSVEPRSRPLRRDDLPPG